MIAVARGYALADDRIAGKQHPPPVWLNNAQASADGSDVGTRRLEQVLQKAAKILLSSERGDDGLGAQLGPDEVLRAQDVR